MANKDGLCSLCGASDWNSSGTCRSCVKRWSKLRALKPCPSCGSTDRQPSGNCRPCSVAAHERFRENHPPDFRSDYHRQWRSRNLMRTRAIQNKASRLRRAVVANASGTFTEAQIRARREMFGHLCWVCRTAPGSTSDHVIAFCNGGSNWPANFRPACKSCNSAKGVLDRRGASVSELLAWAAQRRRAI